LQNRFVPFQFAITFHKIFVFLSEATLSRFLITHIQFKDVSNQRKSEARAISYTIWLNQHQSAICAPLYKRWWFKHRKLDQPFQIKAQNLCNPWEWRPQNYPAQEAILSQIVKKEMSLFEATKKSNNLKLFHALITTKPKSVEPERAFSATGLRYLSQNSETDW